MSHRTANLLAEIDKVKRAEVVSPEKLPEGKQFNTAVAWSEMSTRQSRERIARAVENMDSPEWGDIAIQAAIEDLDAAAALLRASRAAGWQYATDLVGRVIGAIDQCGAGGPAGFWCSLPTGHPGDHAAHDNMPGSATEGMIVETWSYPAPEDSADYACERCGKDERICNCSPIELSEEVTRAIEKAAVTEVNRG